MQLSHNRVNQTLPLSEILTGIRRQIDKEAEPKKVNVVRGRLLEGATRALKRKRFDAHHPLSVKFMDDIGVAEGAVDEGDPNGNC